MGFLQRLYSLYFELGYSLICENHIIDTLEGVSTVIDFLQINAFILSPHYEWGVPALQRELRWALLSFHSKVVDYLQLGLVLLMDVIFAVLLWQISRKGGISSFRILLLARILVAILGSFLFLPILENAVYILNEFITDSHSAYVYSEVILIMVVNVLGLLVPTFLVSFLQGPEWNRLNVSSRASSRQSVG
jgi:hypothetical protein